MLRIALAACVLILTLPTALADPIATVAVGPGPTVRTDKAEPYYFAADISAPEPPRPGQRPFDDCAYRPPPQPGERQPPPDDAESTLWKFLAWAQDPNGSFADWFPTCLVVEVSAGVGAYLSYNVSTGRYYVEFTPLLAPAGLHAAETSVSGTSGAGVTADCIGCPSPP